MTLVHCVLFRKSRSFADIQFDVTTVFLGKSVLFRYRGQKQAFLPWLLGTSFLVNCFISVLLSVLTVPPSTQVGSINQLMKQVERGRYKVMTSSKFYAAILYYSGHRSADVLVQNILADPQGFGSIKQHLELSKKSRIAYTYLRQSLSFLQDKYFVLPCFPSQSGDSSAGKKS